MESKIEKAIRETLVVENKQSIHYAVKKIMEIINKGNDSQTSNKTGEGETSK